MLPFTLAQFLEVFAVYNQAVWPAQVIAYVAGLAMIVALFRPARISNQIIGTLLAAMWLWTGIAYHGIYFSQINKATLAFAALFVIQGVLIFHFAVIHDYLRFSASGSVATAWLGWALVAYALVIYAILGTWTGHRYPALPMFGITPCPVTLLTFGMLLLTVPPVSRWLLMIPLVWSLIGGSAAFLLEVPQDWLLLFSGVAIPFIVLRDRGCLRVTKVASKPRHA